MLYSSSTNGFYDAEVNTFIPEDAVEISYEDWQSLLEAQSQGKVIQPDGKGYPVALDRPAPTKEEKIIQYEAAAQANLDSVAQSWGYRDLVTAASYAASTNAQFKADAEALIAWRDAYWVKAYSLEAGKLPATAAEFVAKLPVAPSQPTV